MKQTINRNNAWPLNIVLLFLMTAALSGMMGMCNALGAEDDKVVAAGDGFVLTQKDVTAFSDYFNANKTVMPQKEVVMAALKYELLSREYQKKMGEAVVSDAPDDGLKAAGIKIRNSEIYIQELLQNHVVSDAVIESYYWSHPEKYGGKKNAGGNTAILPLDDNLKKEITFIVVETKKMAVIKEYVDGLIAKYHIQVQDAS